MIFLHPSRIPSGNWAFLVTIAACLRAMHQELADQRDYTEGTGNVLVTGEMLVYREAMFRRALDLAQSTIACWNEGFHVGAIVCSRGLLETISTFHSFMTQASAAASMRDWAAIRSLVVGCGRSTSMPTRRDQLKSFKPPPRIGAIVKDFINKTCPDALPFWDQISDFSHPNGASTMDHFGDTTGTFYTARSSQQRDVSTFTAIYNSLYASCWLRASDLDFDIVVEEMRTGVNLLSDHPLVQKRDLANKLTTHLISSGKHE
jgi:hypothetical protein